MSNFKKLLKEHKKNITKEWKKFSSDFNKRIKNHDNDKFKNKEIYSIYDEHFTKLKKYKFGTPKYKEYEKKYFTKAHKLHIKNNRHHFYDKRSNFKDIDILDYLEALFDIKVSMDQYEKYYDTKKLVNNFKKKGLFDYKLEELVFNYFKK